MKPFKNPPITEAVFDVKVKLHQSITLESLQTFHDLVKDQFPIKKDRRKIESGIRFEGNVPPKIISAKNEIFGYQFVATDKSKVVQARLDGFTFNKLKPYSNWEEFSGEAVNLLRCYIKIAKPEKIIRLGLRYINRIELPLPFIDFNEYFNTIPTLAPKLNYPIRQFFANFVIINNEINALANLTETIQQEIPEKKILPFILDVDTFKEVNLDLDIGEIMINMNQLRTFKNKIFVESLTDKTLELFK